MEQIKYTDKQLLVLEIIEEFNKLFAPSVNEYARSEYFVRIATIKRKYGIDEKFPTLREYISSHECGAYHTFIFAIDYASISVNGISQFESIYNSSLLDKFYVVDDTPISEGDNCENYCCEHYLTIAKRTN